MSPLIVHGYIPPPPRKCVVLDDGHRYCEDEPGSTPTFVFGIGIFGMVAFIAWLLGVMRWSDSWSDTRWDSRISSGWRIVIGILAPLIVLGIVLVLW